jgi:hypothetical protein
MMIVAQPKSRTLAHRNGELTDAESHEAMNNMLSLQPYTVAGFASVDCKRVLDRFCNYVRDVRPGDSFVEEKQG